MEKLVNKNNEEDEVNVEVVVDDDDVVQQPSPTTATATATATAADRLPEANSLPDGFVDGNNSNSSSSSSSYVQLAEQQQQQHQQCISAGDNNINNNNFNNSSSSPPSPPTQANTEHRETQVGKTKDISPNENAGSNKKAETSEVKRKSSKRVFKSEKEFLEFTIKYQQVIGERDAAITIRDKLESLCRELQRQNKMLMDECKRASTEGQNLRLDISAKFQDAIQEVSKKLEEQKDECLCQLKENEMLRSNLKQFADQYALSEQQHAHKLKQKTLELQLAELKIQQYEEKLVQEQSQMKVYAEQVSQLLTTEKNLRLQLTADGAKFQQFQDALVKSNEVFGTFKQEIEKMTKSIKELKRENTNLKSKCEKSDVTLIQLVQEREHLKKQLEKTRNQKEKLESLCRSLQAERKQSPSISGLLTNSYSV